MTSQRAEVPVGRRIPVGTVVRCVRENADFDAVEGREYVVEAYVPADEGDAEPPQPYYALATMPGDPWCSDTYAAIEDLQILRSAEDHHARMVISAPDLMKSIQDGLMSTFGSDYSINEASLLSEPPGSDEGGFEGPHDYPYGVEFYGRREGGATFGGVIRLTGLWRTDD